MDILYEEVEVRQILTEIEIGQYLEHIVLSKARRPKFFKKGQKIPKKYQNSDYSYNIQEILVFTETGEKVISNPKVAGKARMKKITGQDIWSGMDPFLRSKIARELKIYLKGYLKRLFKIDANLYPIGVKIEFYNTLNNSNWDLDNHALVFRKCIQDVLKDCDIIKEDSIIFIDSIPCKYIPVDNITDKKIIIKLYKEKLC